MAAESGHAVLQCFDEMDGEKVKVRNEVGFL